MGYSLYANEVPFSIIRVSAAYLTSELAGRCGPMHIKQARGAEMICSGQSVCLPVLICTGGLDSKGRDVVHAGQWLPAARHLDADDRRAGQGGTLRRHKIVTRADSEVPIGKLHRLARTAPRRRSVPHRRVRIELRRLLRRAFRDYTRSSLSACRERMRSGPVMLRASARKLLLASIAGRIRNLAVGVPAASRATRPRQLHSGVP